MLLKQGDAVRRGGDYDTWDLEVCGGSLVRAKVRMGVEEYPGGRQNVRFRIRPALRGVTVAATLIWIAMAVAAWRDGAQAASAILIAMSVFLIFRAIGDCCAAMGCLTSVLTRYRATVRGLGSHPANSTEAAEANGSDLAQEPALVVGDA
jgi:hypothetical protein